MKHKVVWGLVLGLGAAPWAVAQNLELGGNMTRRPTLQNLYNVNSCMQVSTNIVDKVCCKRKDGQCVIWATRGQFDYWEPAAIVEVTCRSGFSHLKPGISPRVGGAQSCSTGPNWFFEAHVWASTGRAGGDRSSSLGYSFRENTMRCEADPTTGAGKYPNGYGVKHEGISFNSAGPGGSSQAFISENDANWAKQVGSVYQPQVCTPGSPNLLACWGNPSVATGWVTHPNQAVAAALVGYRGLQKAMALRTVVTPRKDNWRMSMDYPFIMDPGPAAAAMGVGGGGGGRHMGSSCMTPGDAGPWWYTAGQRNVMPSALNLNPAAAAGKKTYAPDGTYIFTYWVRTGCTVFDKQVPFTICWDDFKY